MLADNNTLAANSGGSKRSKDDYYYAEEYEAAFAAGFYGDVGEKYPSPTPETTERDDEIIIPLDGENLMNSGPEIQSRHRMLPARKVTGTQNKSNFYEYPQEIVALLELRYLKELEQGVFLRDKSRSEVHPNLGKLAKQLLGENRELEVFEILLDNCQLTALGNDLFCDAVFDQTTTGGWQKAGKKHKTPDYCLIDSKIIRDGRVAASEAGPDHPYDYPPLLTALLQLGFLEEYNKRIFKCVRDCTLRRKAFSLGALATQGLHRGQEEIFLKRLIEKGELFSCSGQSKYELYWDRVREKVCTNQSLWFYLAESYSTDAIIRIYQCGDM
jgi:hypothetical protein